MCGWATTVPAPRPPAAQRTNLLLRCPAASQLMVQVGSVAVDPATGCRLGKGEGFAELEWGILCWMRAVDPATTLVGTAPARAWCTLRRLP